MDLVQHFSNARNTVSYSAGAVIFRAGQRGTLMFVMLKGLASVMVGDETVEMAIPGTVLGEMALLGDGRRSATVIARRDCVLVPITREQFDVLTKETPAFARYVMKVMAERLRRMNERSAQGEGWWGALSIGRSTALAAGRAL